MLAKDLQALFERDLARLEKEMESYNLESQLWLTNGTITNSAGNLALHLVGNLRHFIGHILGNSTYERRRDDEFELRDIPRTEILGLIQNCTSEVSETLSRLTAADLNSNYPLDVMKQQWTTQQFLLHLSGHLNYHLGQINYHRRLLASK